MEDPAQDRSTDAIKPAFLGNSLIAYGAAVLLFTIVAAVLTGSFTLDIVSLIIIGLGIHVRKGSRRAAKWALAIVTLHFLIVCTFGSILLIGNFDLLSVSGRALKRSEVWWMTPPVVVAGIWSMLNGVFLYRFLLATRKAPGRKESPILAWVLAPPILLLMLFGGCFALSELVAMSRPPYAKPAAIEENYSKQLERLRELATDSEKQVRATDATNPVNVELFGLPEILQAKLETSKNSFAIVAQKPSFKMRGGSGWLCSSPRVGKSVVNITKYTLSDGTTIKTAEYEAVLRNKQGRKVRYCVTFDLKLLASAAKRHPQNE